MGKPIEIIEFTDQRETVDRGGHDNSLYIRAFRERCQCPFEYGFAVEDEKLFRNVRAHSFSTASGDYDCPRSHIFLPLMNMASPYE